MYNDNLPFTNINQYIDYLENYILLQIDRLIEVCPKSDSLIENNLFDMPIDETYLQNIEQLQLSLAKKCRLSKQVGTFIPLYEIIGRLRLKKIQVQIIMLALAFENSTKILKKLNSINVIEKGLPTITAVLILFATHTKITINAQLWEDITKILDIFFNTTKRLDLYTPLSLSSYARAFFTQTSTPLPYFIDIYYNKSVAKASKIATADTVFLIHGKIGCGRKTMIKAFADNNGKAVIFVYCHAFYALSKVNMQNEFKTIVSLCVLYNAWVCFAEADFSPLKSEDANILPLIQSLFNHGITVFATAQSSFIDNLSEKFAVFTINVNSPTVLERVELWKTALESIDIADDGFPEELSKLTFTPAQINMATKEAQIVSDNAVNLLTLNKCCINQATHNLSENAERITPVFTWDELVLPQNIIYYIKQSCNHVNYQSTVFGNWDFLDLMPYGRCVSILFAGPPGTGKTMLAQIIANELNMELYRIDISAVVSKYIGETEKNLDKIFNDAGDSNVILFFDEMDALFGKRSQTQDAHDKYANMETAYLLQKIEEYEGVILLATNFLNNIDQAFMRRIQFIFHIPYPSAQLRLELWKKSFPILAPLSEDIDFEFLANNFEISGAIIKNISVSAAFMAAAEDYGKITMANILRATKIELLKQSKVLLNEDFGEYRHLLEE